MKILGVSVNTKEIIVVAAIGACGVWAAKKFIAEPVIDGLKNAAVETGDAINPVNDDNIFNRGFNAVWQKVTGSPESFGADMYDLVHEGTIFPELKEDVKQ